MTLVSNVNGVSAPSSDSIGIASTSARKNPLSLAHLAKTAGILALALSGGGSVAAARNPFNHGRELQIFQPTNSTSYDYLAACKSGLLDSHDQGLNYEDCMSQKETSLQATPESSSQKTTKQCYTVSGYMTAGFAGSSGLATIGATKAGLELAGVGTSLAVISLLITSVCGIWHRYTGARLQGALDEAMKCCQFFPKQADIREARNVDANKSANNATTNVSSNAITNATASG